MKMKTKTMIVVIYLTMSLCISAANAADFCVDDSEGLSVALFVAGSNGQSDHIKIKQGTYLVPDNQGFIYGEVPTENFSLEISGGWVDFISLCGLQDTDGSFGATILDGNAQFRVLDMIPNGGTAIKISELTFVNGFRTGFDVNNNNGGALLIRPEDGAGVGEITIENNVFLNNHAFSAGALMINQAEQVILRNNLIDSNVSEINNFSISISSENQTGLYAINNTIMNNTGGLYADIEGSSQVLVVNNLIWENDVADLGLIGDGTRFLYNNNYAVLAGQLPDNQAGNISYPPTFEQGTMNFTPSINSPLVGAGKNEPFIVPIPTPFEFLWTVGEHDVEGHARIQGNGIDIGAVESVHEMYVEIPIFSNGFEPFN